MVFPSDLRQPIWRLLFPIFDVLHISEKKLRREKMWVLLILEPVRLLGACKPGSWARMDSRTGPPLKQEIAQWTWTKQCNKQFDPTTPPPPNKQKGSMAQSMYVFSAEYNCRALKLHLLFRRAEYCLVAARVQCHNAPQCSCSFR